MITLLLEKHIGWFWCFIIIFFFWKLWINIFGVSESVVSDITNNLMSNLYSDSISPMFLTNHCTNKTYPASTKQTESEWLLNMKLLNNIVTWPNICCLASIASCYTEISVQLLNCQNVCIERRIILHGSILMLKMGLRRPFSLM
jgi:hypothetical protein